MKLTLKRVLATSAAVAAVGGALIIPAASAGASAPGTAPAGTVTLPSGSIALASTWTMTPPPGTVCPADSASGGSRWQTFIAPASTDPVTLTFNVSGPTVANSYPLFDATQNPINNKGTAAASGLITPINPYSLSALPPGTLPDGAYNVGYACTIGGQVIDFTSTGLGVTPPNGSPALIGKSAVWYAPVTVNGANFSYGAAPAAPALTLGAGTGTTQVVNFTQAAATPAITSYALSVTPLPGAALPTVSPGATSFTLSGLTLGTTYNVSLVPNNGQAGPAGTTSFTAAIVAPAPVVTAPDAFQGNPLTISWLAPASGPAPASYDVAITPGGPTFTGVVGLSQVVPAGLAIGGYTATVTPNYAAGSGVTGTAGSDGFSITPNTLLYQQITVTRPPGALILTQRCGVYGPLNAFTAVDAFPGFPRTLAAELASLDQVGTSPDIDLGTAGVQVDPEFGNYPYPAPATYPTECGLSMGTAKFVTSGALSGQFYTATGRLNQVTVLDTRDTDTGWVARGDVADTFLGSTGNTFSGDYLGWVPQVTSTSDPVGGSTYDQIVSPGGSVLPGTANGLTANPPLAFAAANQGLGIATLDARMNLLIPASADAADYGARLSLTVVPS
jgi:hypothetical protein